jgi:hypothetical protein
VFPPEHHRDDFLLERPKFTPTETVDDMVLKTGMEGIKGIHGE